MAAELAKVVQECGGGTKIPGGTGWAEEAMEPREKVVVDLETLKEMGRERMEKEGIEKEGDKSKGMGGEN